MDIATIIGVFSGIGLIVFSITMNSGLDLFIDGPSLMIVGGGTIAGTLIAYPLNEFLKVIPVFLKVFIYKLPKAEDLVEELVKLGTQAKANGILALDKELGNVKDDFMKMGLQLVVDGVDNETIDAMLHIEVDNVKKRHRLGYEIFDTLGTFAPAFGMIGTLIGLVQMLANLDDPSTIGPKMAVALITTFYGAFFANLLFKPMATKLARRSHQEGQIMALIIEAIKSIRRNEHPKLIESKLNKFLTTKKSKKKESPKEE